MKNFVTFEGIDGSGKTTVSKLVYKKLKENNLKVVLTHEPTNSFLGRIVKKCIETKEDPFVTAFSFIADRIDHCKKIKNWLDKDIIVLCDRYADSTYAYQGAQMQDAIDNPIKWLKDLTKNLIIEPDRIFIFIINPELAISRIKNRENLIYFERKEFLEKVNNNYIRLTKQTRAMKIDSSKSIDDIVDICFDDILS
jgi:dTMP kinase